MLIGRKLLFLGVLGSLFVHASIAFGLYAIIINKFPSLGSTQGASKIFMVSYEDGPGFGSDKPLRPAFSASSREALSKVQQKAPKIKRLTLQEFGGSAAPTEVGGGHTEGPQGPAMAQGGLSVLSSPEPFYPIAARRAGFQGKTVLEVSLASDGTPKDVDIISSSGREDCDESARSTILNRWKFTAVSGEARQKVAIRFRLK